MQHKCLWYFNGNLQKWQFQISMRARKMSSITVFENFLHSKCTYIMSRPHAIFVKIRNLQMFTWIVFLSLIPNIFSSDNSFQKFILRPLKYGFLSISEEIFLIRFCFMKLKGNTGRNELNTVSIWYNAFNHLSWRAFGLIVWFLF